MDDAPPGREPEKKGRPLSLIAVIGEYSKAIHAVAQLIIVLLGIFD